MTESGNEGVHHTVGTGGRVEWMRGPCACPSLPHDSFGPHDANISPPHEGQAQGPRIHVIHPLSLQHGRERVLLLPDLVVKDLRKVANVQSPRKYPRSPGGSSPYKPGCCSPFQPAAQGPGQCLLSAFVKRPVPGTPSRAYVAR